MLPTKAPPRQAYDWNGFYFGGHVGYGQGRANATVTDPAVTSLANTFGGNIAGGQFGYSMVLPSRVLLGLETDLTFANYLDSNAFVAQVPTARSNVIEQYDYTGTVRARLGYVADPWMIFVTGGYAFAGTRVLNTPPNIDEEKKLNVRNGWSLGAGAEYALSAHWSARVEYLYSQYVGADAQFPSGTHYWSTFNFQELRVGLSRKLGAANSIEGDAKIGTESDRWELHAQTTYIQQGYPSFRALYSGPNSLSPFAQTRETWTNSAYVGVRVWDGGAVYYIPELLQGFGLSDTIGLGGFSNGEAQKSHFPLPRYSTSRLFLRQTFGFGGEQETLESAPNQLAEKVDVSRLTVQAGRFAVTDVFDNNSYAKDTRKDFMNWALWAPGAFDYAADKIGLTWGAAAELNQKDWALRAGRARPADRRRRAQLPDRAHPRILLFLCAARHHLADLRLPIHRQPGLQRRPRAGEHLLGPAACGSLKARLRALHPDPDRFADRGKPELPRAVAAERRLGNSPRTSSESLPAFSPHDVVLPTTTHGQIRLRCVTWPDPAQAALLNRLPSACALPSTRRHRSPSAPVHPTSAKM